MYHCFIDESTEGTSDFFTVGAILVPHEKIKKLHNDVKEIRHKYKYNAGDTFKFSTNERPKQITPQECAKAKKELFKTLAENEIAFYAVTFNKKINPNTTETIERTSNTLLKYICAKLKKEDKNAFIFYDRHKAHDNMDKKLQHFDYTDPILAFSQTSDNASHYSSVCDILTGTLRYIISNPKHNVCTDLANQLRSIPHSIMFAPREVKSKSYQSDYQNLGENLKKLELNLLKHHVL